MPLDPPPPQVCLARGHRFGSAAQALRPAVITPVAALVTLGIVYAASHHYLSPVVVAAQNCVHALCPASHVFASATSRAFQRCADAPPADAGASLHRTYHRSDHKTMAGVKAVIRLRCPAGVAKPGPAIGQALSPHG